MSNLQFGTLKYIREHNVTVEEVKTYNLTTFGSIVARKWVARHGSRIVLTRKGDEAFEAYYYAMCNYRQHAGEITDRVRTLLHIGQLQMMKTGAALPAAIEKAG